MYHMTVDGATTVCGQDIYSVEVWGKSPRLIATGLVNLVDCPDCIERLPNRRELKAQIAESHRKWKSEPCHICGAPRFRCSC